MSRRLFAGLGLGLAAAITLALAPSIAAAQNAPLDRVKAALQKQLGGRAEVKGIATTPVPGIYEANLGSELVYTDASGRYLIQGDLIDLSNSVNLTEARQAKLNQIRFADLPLDQAMVVKHGDGSRRIAVFADPNCGYCKQFEGTLEKTDNVTIYTFLIPILSPDSAVKSRQVWCASDRSKTWADWMVRHVALVGEGKCATPIEKNLELARKLNVTGTPTIFFADGSRVTGAIPGASLEQKLAAVGGAAAK